MKHDAKVPTDGRHAIAEAEALATEAGVLHEALFGRSPSSRFVGLYVEVHRERADLFAASQTETDTVCRVVKRGLDIAGIEVLLRRPGLRHLLSRKLMLAGYLAECDGEHPESRPLSLGRMQAYGGIAMAGLRGAIRLARARFQIWRHEIV